MKIVDQILPSSQAMELFLFSFFVCFWYMVVRCWDLMLIKQLMELLTGIDLKEGCRDFIGVEFNFSGSNLEDVYFNHLFFTEPSPHCKKLLRKISYRRSSIP